MITVTFLLIMSVRLYELSELLVMMVLAKGECLHVMLNVSLEGDEVSIESVRKLEEVVVERTELCYIENIALLECPLQPSNVISHPMKVISQCMKIDLKLMKRWLLEWRRIVRLKEW